MCQLPLDSHWATRSQTEAALADPPVAMPPTMVAAPAIPTPAMRCLTETFLVAACFDMYCMGVSFLTRACGVSCRVGASGAPSRMRLHPETRSRPLVMRFDTHALTGHTGSPVLARPTGVGCIPGWRGSARSGNGFDGCPCEVVGAYVWSRTRRSEPGTKW